MCPADELYLEESSVNLQQVEQTAQHLNKLKLATSTSSQLAHYRKNEAGQDVLLNAACTGFLGGMAASAFYSPVTMIPAFAKYMMVAGGTIGIVMTARATSEYMTAVKSMYCEILVCARADGWLT